jgi:uroporphyrinogen-III synthase
VTARAARRAGLRVAVVAEEHTVEGLLNVLAQPPQIARSEG